MTLPLDTLLRILFRTEREGIDWRRGPHTALAFGGRPPIDLVSSGTGRVADGAALPRRRPWRPLHAAKRGRHRLSTAYR
jgi:hypothetical protein